MFFGSFPESRPPRCPVVGQGCRRKRGTVRASGKGRGGVGNSQSAKGLLSKGIGFRSLQDGAIDTTAASGELMFNIFSSLAQFERRLIQERTRAGLHAAWARSRLGGRRPIRPNDPRW